MVPSGMLDPSAAATPHGEGATLELTRGDIGFSAAHFSIIDGRAERLHGHNYAVALRAHGALREDSTVLDFHTLKAALRAACATLDERTLIPERSTTLRIRRDADCVEVVHQQRRYVFPIDDVCLLPLDNTTCECLAAHLLGLVRSRLGAAAVRLEVSVSELPGQGATVKE